MNFRHQLPRTALAVALTGMGLAAHAQAPSASTVTIYGVIDAGVRYGDGLDAAYAGTPGNTTVLNSGINTTSRLGYRGSEDLGGGLKAVFNLESGLNIDTGVTSNATKFFDRASVVGLQGGFGTVTLGRQTTLLADTNGVVDPLGSRFASFNPNVSISALSSHRLGLEFGPSGATTGSFRLDNSIKYAGQFGNLGLRAMHAMGEQSNGAGKLSSNGLGVGYQSGAIAASLAYTDMKTVNDLKLNAYFGGVKGKVGNTTLALSYAKSDAQTAASATTTNKVLGLGATVPLASNIDLVLAHYRVNRARTGSTDDGYNRTFAFVEYKFSARTLAYLEVDQTGWKNNYQGTGNKSSATGLSMGLKQTF